MRTSHERHWSPVPGAVRRAIEGTKTGLRTLFATVHASPIIVLGNQKSGTTAVAALLAEMTGLSVTLDLKKEMKDPVIDRLTTGGLSMADFVRLNKLDFSRDIIKEPSLSPFYRELADFFPRSKFVMVIRDPRDNIRSILDRLRIPGDLADVTDEHRSEVTRAWELIIDGRWLGLQGETYIEMLAERWNYITDIYVHNADRIVLLRYEDFSRDKTAMLDRLAKTLGLEKRHDVSHRVDVQFQPAGNRSVRWDEFFGTDNLSRIERICSDRMEKLGYPSSL